MVTSADVMAFLRTLAAARPALEACGAPVLVWLRARGLSPGALTAAEWAAGLSDPLGASRAVAAALGLPETRSPQTGDPCVVDARRPSIGIALEAGDQPRVGLIEPASLRVFVMRRPLLAAWSLAGLA